MYYTLQQNQSFRLCFIPFITFGPVFPLTRKTWKRLGMKQSLNLVLLQVLYLTLWACIVRFRTAASMVAFLNSPKVIFCPISTNKISLERSCNYLNADSLCEKIRAKMNSWRAFEVGRQIVVGWCSGQSKIFRLTGCWRRGPHCHGNSLQLDCSGAEIEEEQSCRVVKERAS